MVGFQAQEVLILVLTPAEASPIVLLTLVFTTSYDPEPLVCLRLPRQPVQNSLTDFHWMNLLQQVVAMLCTFPVPARSSHKDHR